MGAIIAGALLLLAFCLPWLVHWPAWITLVLTVLAGAGLIVVAMWICSRVSSPPILVRQVPGPPLPAPSAERRSAPIAGVLLPSSRDDYCFLLSATVFWLPVKVFVDGPAVNMNALAVDAILSRAREITEQRDPGHASMVRHELGRVLGEMREDATGCLRAMAESVELVLPEQDQQRLDKLAAVRKDKDVWEHERKYEESKREYLGDDVLKDTGSAVVWWLARNDDQVEKTVRDIGLLTQLSCAANNAEVPQSLHPAGAQSADGGDMSWRLEGEKSAAEHFDAFLTALRFDADNPQRALFARRVADLAARHERQEVADELVRRFDVPDGSGRSREEGEDDVDLPCVSASGEALRRRPGTRCVQAASCA
jgi:hypothetical protein